MRKETELSDEQMPVVAWVEPEYEDHFGCDSIQAYRSEKPGWEPLVRQSDAQAKLAAKDEEIAALKAERDALKVAAKYAEHIDATPENQLQTMLFDTMTERDELKVSAELYRWLTEYFVSDDCSVDDAIVACKSPAEISAVIAAAIAKE